jgi:IS5 family transposase
MYDLGDETVIERYFENPYWQHFCGEVYFNTNFHLTQAILYIFVTG